MDRQAIIDLVENKIFTAVFIKKDGTERQMTCRRGVKKFLKGGELKYNPADHDLLGVFELRHPDDHVGVYRMIPTDDRLLELHVAGMKLDFRKKD